MITRSGVENLVAEELYSQELIDIQECKNSLQTKLSIDLQQLSRTPKELSFKDLVRNFDFQDTHSAKLLRKQSRSTSISLDSEHCPPSHGHLIRHESIGLRKGKSVPSGNGSAIQGLLQQWRDRQKTVTEVRQRANQRYGRKMPLPRIVVQQVVEEVQVVDFSRCLSISEGQRFWDDLVTKEASTCLSPRSVTRYSLSTTKAVSYAETSLLSTSSTTLEEIGRDDLSVTGGITFSEEGPLSRRIA